MAFDDTGTIWLADPWMAVAVLVGLVALVVWCHRWIETGSAPRPRAMAIRSRTLAPRRLRLAGESGAADASAPSTTAAAPIRLRRRPTGSPRTAA